MTSQANIQSKHYSLSKHITLIVITNYSASILSSAVCMANYRPTLLLCKGLQLVDMLDKAIDLQSNSWLYIV